MAFTKTRFEGLLVYDPLVFNDDRGYFFESYNENVFTRKGLNLKFVQDNEAYSTRGVLRGLHYQTGNKAQTKLVRVVRGKVLDVVVDLRDDSSTYGEYYSITLSSKNKRQLLVPKGFAHGYLTLSKRAIFCYKCDEFYSKKHEAGLIWNDPQININWEYPHDKITLSEKDKLLPSFGNHLNVKD